MHSENIAVYQVGASRDMRQDDVKLALKALGLSSEDGQDVVTQGRIMYTQRGYSDFNGILGSVTLHITIGSLKEGQLLNPRDVK